MMIKAYKAANGAEVHLILDLLNQSGLHARIDGEYLQGGIGDLQAFGMIRVMVEESGFEPAKTLIKMWENNEVIVFSLKTSILVKFLLPKSRYRIAIESASS